MTKLRRFSSRSANYVLSFVLLLILSAGCTTSTTPTYTKAGLDTTIERILKEEYQTEARARLVGGTIWIYVPVENLFEKTTGKDPDDKVKERFDVQENESLLRDELLSVSYLVKPIVPEREKDQGYKLNKKAMEKINHAWEVMRRIAFSMKPAERDEIKFYVLMAGDVINGFELRETIYYKDLIKVLYRAISPGEYHHRVAVKSGIRPEIIGDTKGERINFTEMKMEAFLCSQIEHRIGLKFQKPEVEQNADIDREIRKIVVETLKIYEFSNFRVAELTNLLTNANIHVDSGDVNDFKKLR